MKVEELISKYGSFIKSEIYLHCKDSYVVDEVFQRVIIKIWRKAPESINGSFLVKVVRNMYIDYYRNNKKHLEALVPIEDVKYELYDFHSYYNADDNVSKKEEKIDRELLIKSLFEEIDKLKESQREAFILRIAGLNFIEISKMINSSHSNAISQMYYAKQNLKKLCKTKT
jgi:RNA polymerase sigma factor (sigma-70 family)